MSPDDKAFFACVEKRLHRVSGWESKARGARLIYKRLVPRSDFLGRAYAVWSVINRRHWETPGHTVILGARPVGRWIRLRSWLQGDGKLPSGVLLFDFSSTRDDASAREVVLCVRAVLDAADARGVNLLARISPGESRIARFYASMGFQVLDSSCTESNMRFQWLVRRPKPSLSSLDPTVHMEPPKRKLPT